MVPATLRQHNHLPYTTFPTLLYVHFSPPTLLHTAMKKTKKHVHLSDHPDIELLTVRLLRSLFGNGSVVRRYVGGAAMLTRNQKMHLVRLASAVVG
jgi:hypothetical protein